MSPCVLVCPRPLHLPRGEIAGHSEQSAARLCRGTYDGWLCLRTLVASGHCPSLHRPHSFSPIEKSLEKVAKLEPSHLSLSGGANMYVAVHLFIRFYFFFDGYSGAGRARANGRIFLGGPRWGGGPRWALSLPSRLSSRNASACQSEITRQPTLVAAPPALCSRRFFTFILPDFTHTWHRRRDTDS